MMPSSAPSNRDPGTHSRRSVALIASAVATSVVLAVLPATGQVPPTRPPGKKVADAAAPVAEEIPELYQDLTANRFGFQGGVAERAGRPEVIDLEPAVGVAELILAVRLVDVTETKIVHGGRNEQVTQQFRFEPIRVLKGIYARDSLLMTGQDLGIYRFAEGADRLVRGQMMLVLLGRQGLGYMNCNGGATLAESIPRISGTDDPLLGAVDALIGASRDRDRASKVAKLRDGLKGAKGRAAGPLLYAIGRRSYLAAQTPGVIEAIAPLLETQVRPLLGPDDANPAGFRPAFPTPSSPALREVAAKTIGTILDADPSKRAALGPIASKALVSALEGSGPDVAARSAAIDALGSIGEAARNDPAALNWLRLDRDAPTLAESAARLRSLGKLGASDQKDAIAKIYGSQPLDAPPGVPDAAGNALAKLDPKAAGPLISARLARKNEAGLGLVPEIALLGALPADVATPELLKAWNFALDLQDRLAFASACDRVADPRLVPALGTLLDPGQYQIRALAVKALVKIGTDEAASTLWPHLGEEADLSSRLRLVAFLGRHGFRDGYAQAIEHLSVPNLRDEAVSALAAINEPKAIPELRRIWQTSNDVTWNSSAIRALARLGQADIAPRLLELAANSGDALSSSALIGLADLGSAEALPIVLEALSSRSDERVIAAASASSRLLSLPGMDARPDAPRIRARLAALLADGDASIPPREAALDALVTLNDPGLWPALAALAKDANLEGTPLMLRAERLLARRKVAVALLERLRCNSSAPGSSEWQRV